MNCPACNVLLVDGSNFCHNCGLSIKDHNGNIIPASNIFSQTDSSIAQALKRLMPTSYVEKLLSSDGKTEGERRVVTILFSDIKGSTALGENLDPEEVLYIMNGAFDTLIKPIMKYEGTLARLMGDAILAFFGAPIAHEDDPQRACRAALDIIEGSNEFSQRLYEEKGIEGFSVRVGINTGLVVVAEVGADLRVEYTAMGDAVNVASRMESSAEPGTILITEETFKLLPKSFITKPIGPIKVKGKQNSVNSFQLLSENTSDKSCLQNLSTLNPLIGRDSELKGLLQIFNELETDKGKILSLFGECGTGKSRLVSEVKNRISNKYYWMEGKCLAYRRNNSYWLIKNLLFNHFYEEGNNSKEELIDIIKDKIIISKSTNYSEIFPFIAFLLDNDNHNETIKKSAQLDPGSFRGQIHYAVKEYIRYQTRNKPFIILLEDLQWCDSSSLDLIKDLFSIVNETKIIFIITFRKGEHEFWELHNNYLKINKENYNSIELRDLSIEHSLILIKNNIKKFNLSIPENIVLEILKVADGNPFFIEEISKSLVDHQINDLNFEEEKKVKIPNLLQGVILSRLDNLSQINKIVLQSASVIGRSFPKKLLMSTLNDSMSETEIGNSLSQLEEKGFISKQIKDSFIIYKKYSDTEFVFTQSLIQEVCYSTLLIVNRQKMHLKVAEQIELNYSNQKNQIADSLAVHFEKGKDFIKSIYYFKLAADKAKNLFANREAIYFYNKILSLSKHINNEVEIKAEVFESLGDIYFGISKYSKSIENFENALSYDNRKDKKITIYQKFGHVFERWGQYEKSVFYFNKALDFLGDENNKLLKARSFLGISMVHYRQENLEESLHYSEKALVTLVDSGKCLELSQAYNNLGIIYIKMSKYEDSENYFLSSLKISKGFENISGIASTYNNLGYLYQLQNRNSDALKYYALSIDICERIGNLHGLAKIYDNLSNIYMLEGKGELANSYNLKAMEIIGRIAVDSSDINQDVWLQSGVW